MLYNYVEWINKCLFQRHALRVEPFSQELSARFSNHRAWKGTPIYISALLKDSTPCLLPATRFVMLNSPTGSHWSLGGCYLCYLLYCVYYSSFLLFFLYFPCIVSFLDYFIPLYYVFSCFLHYYLKGISILRSHSFKQLIYPKSGTLNVTPISTHHSPPASATEPFPVSKGELLVQSWESP